MTDKKPIPEDNRARRAAGERALRPYAPKVEGYQTALVDLLTNVMHATALLEYRGHVDFDDALASARLHYAAETGIWTIGWGHTGPEVVEGVARRSARPLPE